MMRASMGIVVAVIVAMTIATSGIAKAKDQHGFAPVSPTEELLTEHAALPMSMPATSNQMTPAPSQQEHAQLMGMFCRWGYYVCVLPWPAPVGIFCWCPGFTGLVSTW